MMSNDEPSDADPNNTIAEQQSTHTNNNVASIHRETLKLLLPRCSDTRAKQKSSSLSTSQQHLSSNNHDGDEEEQRLQETLMKLKVHKARLLSELAVAFSGADLTTTVAETLSHFSNHLGNGDSTRPYLRPFHGESTPSSDIATRFSSYFYPEALIQLNQPETIKSLLQNISRRPTNEQLNTQNDPSTDALATTLSSIRKRRRIVGAHRLSGISTILIPNTDPNSSACIGARFDVCTNEGEFILPLNMQPYYSNQFCLP